jgi:hypothetical protein
VANTFTDNRDRWLQMSEVDYLGQFVKAWLGFNAWYRSAYSETRDRAIIEEIKWNPNTIAARFRPLLGLESEEAEQFRSEIGLLHHRLERYELHNGKGSEKTRIRFSQIVIRTEPPITESFNYRGYQCDVRRIQNGSITFEVKDPSGTSIVNLTQTRFDINGLNSDTSFNSNLTDNLKTRCRKTYNLVNPRLQRDLTLGDEQPLLCGTHTFKCGPDFLFAGVLEVIYLMRCTLFHGELVPTQEASECYEPAYRIIRRFLKAV